MKKITQFILIVFLLIISINICSAGISTCGTPEAPGTEGWSCVDCTSTNCSGCKLNKCLGADPNDPHYDSIRCCPSSSGGSSSELKGMSAVRKGLSTSANEAGLDTGADPKTMATDIIGYALGFVGIIIFINMLFAGYQWIMSGGNEDTIGKAKNRIKNSVIGLVIIAAAYAITSNLFTILKDVVTK